MMITPPDTIQQAAVVAVQDGRICLVTSRSGKRWVVPKGCLELGKTAGEIALQEAWEEAGLLGVLDQEPVGSYLYEKAGNRYHVTVFFMHVTEVAADWPENAQRRRCWVSPTESARRVYHDGLIELLHAVSRTMRDSERVASMSETWHSSALAPELAVGLQG
jgi:8-oxo-dGTP pyrophosphatase MutT (NUDIX family)